MNSVYYSEEDIKKGLHLKFIKFLLEENTQSDYQYHDIHMYSEENAIIIEWCDRRYDGRGEDGRFVYIEGDEYIFKEYIFPDNHSEYFMTDDEYKEALDEWLKNNPGWVKTSYDTWTNEIENEAFRKMLEENKKKEED